MMLLGTNDGLDVIGDSDVLQAAGEALGEAIETISDPSTWLRDLASQYLPVVIDKAVLILFALLVYFVGMKISKYLRKIIRRSMERSHLDYGIIHFTDSFAKVVLYFILFSVIIGLFGLETTSLAAVVGSAGLAVGLALQGSLSNFAGGVLLLLLHPFKVGDYIVESSNKSEGVVEKIELFYTTLLTGDNKRITIPNGTLANCSITNVSAEEKRRLDFIVGIGYQSDLKKAKEVIEGILKSEPAVLLEEPMAVFVDDLADSAVMVGLRVWLKSSDFLAAKWRIVEAIKLEFDKEGIEIPFNQLDVNLKQSEG